MNTRYHSHMPSISFASGIVRIVGPTLPNCWRARSIWSQSTNNCGKFQVTYVCNWMCQTTFWIRGVQVWNADFFLKEHVKFARMMKSTLFKVCSIACHISSPPFGQFVNTTSIKSSLFAANNSSSHFFTSSYESKRCSTNAWPIDVKGEDEHKCFDPRLGKVMLSITRTL